MMLVSSINKLYYLGASQRVLPEGVAVGCHHRTNSLAPDNTQYVDS